MLLARAGAEGVGGDGEEAREGRGGWERAVPAVSRLRRALSVRMMEEGEGEWSVTGGLAPAPRAAGER